MRSTLCALVFAAGLAACGGIRGTSGATGETTRRDPAPWRTYLHGLAAVTGFAPAPRDFPLAAQLAALKADGFRWIRFGLPWDRIETAPGVYDWAAADALVDAVRGAGLEFIWTLKYGNPLYPPAKGTCETIADNSDDYRCPPPTPTPFAAFAAAAARHFGSRVAVYEVWNEANGWYRFWPVKAGGDPAALAALTVAAADAVHGVCAGCTVLFGGLVFHAVPPLVMGQGAFLDAALAAEPGLFGALDGVGLHHYTFYPPSSPPERDTLPEAALERVLAETRVACACDLPLWITETGWPTTVIDERDQARFALRGLLIALAGGVESWIWWSVRELEGQTLVAGPEAEFGLRTPGDRPRPGYTALARFLRDYGAAVRVRDARQELGLAAPAEWAVELASKNGDRVLVVWADTRVAPVSIPTLAGRTGVNLVTGAAQAADALTGDPVVISPSPLGD